MTLAPPPPLDLPSLNSLRAFEAAARLGSFARAAEELVTTPAGVAQHVKKVEAWAEQKLFERSARGVQLNSSGQAALVELSEGFAAIGRGAIALRSGRKQPRTLHITALPAIAQLWVVPRMAEIARLVPHADVSIHASDATPDLRTERYDVAISYERVDALATDSGDELVPVAAPHVAARLLVPAHLAKEHLLHDSTWKHHWALWLAAAGLADQKAEAGTSYSLYAMAIDSAVRGDGVLIGRLSLVEPYLEQGTLVAPFELRIPTGDAIRIRLSDPSDATLAPLTQLGHVAF
jgi:LysR family transcriptional regulator, glycine cleavage system transcriptional activator